MRPTALSAPAKLTLFGEWAVTRGYPGLAVALQTRFRVDYAPGPSGLTLHSPEGSLRLASLDQEVPAFWRLAVRAWRKLELPFEGDVRFARDWRIEEGLGSSSALLLNLVGLASLLGRGPFQDRPVSLANTEAIWRETRALIRELQSPRASGLDAAAQAWGASVVLEDTRVESLFLEKPPELVLIHTGRKMDTAAALAAGVPADRVIEGLGDSCRRLLKTHDWPTALEEHFTLLGTTHLVPDFVREVARSWKASGLVQALKTTGAGGGDALLAWSPPEKHETLKQEVTRIGGWISNIGWNAEGLKKEAT